MTTIEKALAKQKKAVTGVSTGYTDLDKKTSGLQPSDLIIVAARPSMGKCIVSGSTLVNPASGALVTIDEMVNNEEGAVTSITNDFKLRPAQASAFVNDGVKPVFEVRTALGRSIQTTITHPFLSGNGWQALANLEEGDYIALLDHDDEISIDALFENAKVINRYSDVGLIYSDEDKMEMDGSRLKPYFKPDFSPDLPCYRKPASRSSVSLMS